MKKLLVAFSVLFVTLVGVIGCQCVSQTDASAPHVAAGVVSSAPATESEQVSEDDYGGPIRRWFQKNRPRLRRHHR